MTVPYTIFTLLLLAIALYGGYLMGKEASGGQELPERGPPQRMPSEPAPPAVPAAKVEPKAPEYALYDLTSAPHLGSAVDAFRVYYTKEVDTIYETAKVEFDVGYTDDVVAAREYVSKYVTPGKEGFFYTWGRTYHVEAVSLFKLPSGELAMPAPYKLAPALPSVNEHAVLCADEEEES